MNLSTHIVFGIIVGALLFGRPEIALMVGIGSAINDLDREYGFLAKSPFDADKYIVHYFTISCLSA
jgi:membrane-bound metal-dependent hydrolase YbcI (DUF457 family)